MSEPTRRPHEVDKTPDPDRSRLLEEEERRKFHAEIVAKEKRVRRARVEGDRTLRWGYGAFGTVGWSIAVPTLIGTVIGLALDRRFGSGVRYTLSCLIAGIVIGMINVWKWMNAE